MKKVKIEIPKDCTVTAWKAVEKVGKYYQSWAYCNIPYIIGKITETPKGEPMFCYKTKKSAIEQGLSFDIDRILKVSIKPFKPTKRTDEMFLDIYNTGKYGGFTDIILADKVFPIGEEKK